MNQSIQSYLKNIFKIEENGIYMILAVDQQDNLKLLHFSAAKLHENDLVLQAIPEGFPFLGIELAGFNRPYERHRNKYIVTAPGYRMKYVDLKDESLSASFFLWAIWKMKRHRLHSVTFINSTIFCYIYFCHFI